MFVSTYTLGGYRCNDSVIEFGVGVGGRAR